MSPLYSGGKEDSERPLDLPRITQFSYRVVHDPYPLTHKAVLLQRGLWLVRAWGGMENCTVAPRSQEFLLL